MAASDSERVCRRAGDPRLVRPDRVYAPHSRPERPGHTTVAAVSIKGLQCTDYAVIRETRHRRPDGDPAPAGGDGLVPVGPRVALGRISADDAGELVEACAATGPNFDPTPQSPILLHLVRRNAPRGQSTWHWDVDEAIQLASPSADEFASIPAASSTQYVPVRDEAPETARSRRSTSRPGRSHTA
jgi:hypothetical protein